MVGQPSSPDGSRHGLQPAFRIVLRTFDGPLPPEFRRYCLEHGLWEKTYETSHFHTLWRSEKVALGDGPVLGTIVALAFPAHDPAPFVGPVTSVNTGAGDRPVGLGVLERRADTLPAEVRKATRGMGDKVERRHPWCLRVVGRLAFYVEPEFRRAGLATRLLHTVEEARRQELDSERHGWSPEDVATTIALGRAFTLAQVQSSLFRCLPSEEDTRQRRFEISDIVNGTFWHRLGDPYPDLRPLPDWTHWPRPAAIAADGQAVVSDGLLAPDQTPGRSVGEEPADEEPDDDFRIR